MKKNMGIADRIIRLLLAAILISLYVEGKITGPWAILALVLAAVFTITSLVRSCPLYLPFGLSTLKKRPARSNP
jgi:mannose/fructose/N-acetylgalactosamine-specific phosphotransferase system component IID